MMRVSVYAFRQVIVSFLKEFCYRVLGYGYWVQLYSILCQVGLSRHL